MAIDFHYIFLSPPCRAVMMVAKHLGIELNLINVDLMTGQHMTPEFEKLNPAKLVPTIVDNGFALGESRAIITYLVNQYAPGHKLYPADPKKRAQIDRVLYLTAELFLRGRQMGKVILRENKWPVPDDLIDNYVELLKVLEQLVAGHKFLAGDEMSIADISFICDVATVFSVDVKTVAPGIGKWIETMKNELPEFEEFIEAPKASFKAMIEAKTGFKIE